MKKIIICAPAGQTTGGPELAHQLCNELNKYDCFDAYIYYYGKGDKVIPTPYRKYNIDVANKIQNDKDTIIVVPETAIELLSRFKKTKKIIWWMSVDNYLFVQDASINKIRKLLGLNFDFKKDSSVVHLVQSEYAKDFLKQLGISESNIFHVSDYLNASFIKNSENAIHNEKKNVVLYNPKKGYETTKKIIEYNKDITFIPLINLTREEMIDLLSTSKIYIDFGNHPGKDRIPREAAINGCCIITGKKGSAKYYNDVAIDDKYKYDDDNIDMEELRNTMINIFDNYESEICNFENYRNKIKNEEAVFNMEVQNTFNTIVK